MSIFDKFSGKDEEYLKKKTPKFVKVSYDEKGRPIDISPTEHMEEKLVAELNENDKKLLIQWLNAIYESINVLRQELSADKKNLEGWFYTLNSNIDEFRQSLPRESYEAIPEIENINRNINHSADQVLKAIHSSIITKEELMGMLGEVIHKAEKKPPKPNILKTIGPTVEKILKIWLQVKEDENVLIITDKKMIKLGRLFFNMAVRMSHANLMIIENLSRDGEEPDQAVAEAMKVSDVIIMPTFHSLSHTKAAREAAESGARIASMPRVPLISFVKGGLTAEPNGVKALAIRMSNTVKDCKKIKVTSSNGTNVEFVTEGRRWSVDDGNITSGKIGNLPAGEVFVAPVEESVNGTIVFDSFEITNGRFGVVVENGLVKRMEGKLKKIRKIFKQLGPKSRTVGEFGIGCNARARIIGNTLEDEKVYGTVHLAFGNNISFGGKNDVQLHADGIIFKPTVEIDGRIIIKDGQWL